MKKKKIFYLVMIILFVISVFIGTITIKIKDYEKSGLLTEPVIEELNFFNNNVYNKLENESTYSIYDELLDTYLNIDNNMNGPYMIHNPFGVENAALIIFYTKDQEIVELQFNGESYIEKENKTKHIFLINNIKLNDNYSLIYDNQTYEYSINEENNINYLEGLNIIDEVELTNNYKLIRINNEYNSLLYIDDTGYIINNYYIEKDYDLYYLDDYLYIVSKNIISVYDKDTLNLIKEINVNNIISNYEITSIKVIDNNILLYNKSKNLILSIDLDSNIKFIIGNKYNLQYNLRKYVIDFRNMNQLTEYTLDNNILTITTEDNIYNIDILNKTIIDNEIETKISNIKEIELIKYNFINNLNNKYIYLNVNELLEYKDNVYKNYNIKFVDNMININEENIKYITLISSRGYGYQYEYNNYIDINNLSNGKYYIFVIDKDNNIYNTGKYIEY